MIHGEHEKKPANYKTVAVRIESHEELGKSLASAVAKNLELAKRNAKLTEELRIMTESRNRWRDDYDELQSFRAKLSPRHGLMTVATGQ